jgi:threonine/homoserine/homoserine lactone efflux protein
MNEPIAMTQEAFNRIMAVIFLAVALWLAFRDPKGPEGRV